MPGLRPLAVLVLAAASLAACSSAGASPSAAPASAAPPSAAPASAAAGSSAAASVNPAQMSPVTTLEMKSVGALGNVMVASNGFTVYTFAKDVMDSGKSACTGGCLAKWPAVTVAAGASATAGTGVTGKLATISREDNSAIQVTYNGLPLYFFQGDAKAGDGNGVYTNWAAVKP